MSEHGRTDAAAARPLVSGLTSRGPRFDYVVLAAMVGLTTGLNQLWLSRDHLPPYVDYARHLGDSLVTYHNFSLAHPLQTLQLYQLYPSFSYWITDLFYLPFGTAQWVAILSQSAFMAILVYSTYGIGKTLWSRRVGLLSALFVLTTPLLVSMFKEEMLDPPLTAMVALALYVLIRCDSFDRRLASIVLGAVAGCGLLTKWAFAISVIFPVGLAIAIGIAAALRERRWRRPVNMLLALGVTLLVAGPWYFHNWTAIRTDTNKSANPSIPEPALGSASSLLWYFWNLLNNQLYLVPFVFFVVGVIAVVTRPASARRNELLIANIVGTYVLFAMIRNKDFRYTMPMLPALSVVATHWLVYLQTRLRRIVSWSLVGYCVAAYLVISFGTGGLLPKQITIPLPVTSFTSSLREFVPPESPHVTGVVLFAQHGFLYGPPQDPGWIEERAFKDIAARGGNRGFSYQYDTPDPDPAWFNTWTVRYWALRYGLNWVYPQVADFIVDRSLATPPVPPGFHQLEHLPLPDGHDVYVFERNGL